MSDIASLHDKLFRSIMADKTIAVDYFKTYLPSFVSQQLDFETLTQLSDVYVSGDLEKYISDLARASDTLHFRWRSRRKHALSITGACENCAGCYASR